MLGPARFRQHLSHVTGERGRSRLAVVVGWGPSGGRSACWLTSPPAALPLVPCALLLPLAPGLVLLNWNDDRSMAFSTFKLFLPHTAAAFKHARPAPWNRAHPAAAAIFTNPLALAGVRSTHAALYATNHLAPCRAGTLGAGGRDVTGLKVLLRESPLAWAAYEGAVS